METLSWIVLKTIFYYVSKDDEFKFSGMSFASIMHVSFKDKDEEAWKGAVMLGKAVSSIGNRHYLSTNFVRWTFVCSFKHILFSPM